MPRLYGVGEFALCEEPPRPRDVDGRALPEVVDSHRPSKRYRIGGFNRLTEDPRLCSRDFARRCISLIQAHPIPCARTRDDLDLCRSRRHQSLDSLAQMRRVAGRRAVTVVRHLAVLRRGRGPLADGHIRSLAWAAHSGEAYRHRVELVQRNGGTGDASHCMYPGDVRELRPFGDLVVSENEDWASFS